MKLDQAAKFVSLYFLYTGQKKELAAGEHRYITLNRISANAGKSKTQVEFMPPQVIDSTTNKASSTDSSSQNLDVITHRGSQINPFHAAFIDSNRILNDGVSEITLKLQVMNVINPEAIAGADPNIALKAGKSQFVIAFDLADENGTQAWALCRTSDFQVSAAGAIWEAKKLNWTLNYSDFEDPTHGQGEKSGELVWTPPNDVTLPPGDALVIELQGLKSSLPPGATNLSIRYRNIAGYVDGQLVLVIEKSPLLFSRHGVGIGTAYPSNLLDVAGGVVIGQNYAGTNTQAPANGLLVEGKVGIGMTNPAALLEVGLPSVDFPSQSYGAETTVAISQRVADSVGLFIRKAEGSPVLRFGSDVASTYITMDYDTGRLNVGMSTPDSSPTLALQPDGKVGIGLTDPKKTFEIYGADHQFGIRNTKGITWGLTNWQQDNRLYFQIQNEKGMFNVAILDDQGNFTLPNGRVGIGLTDPKKPLEIYGADHQFGIRNTNGVTWGLTNWEKDNRLYFQITDENGTRNIASLDTEATLAVGKITAGVATFTNLNVVGTTLERMTLIETNKITNPEERFSNLTKPILEKLANQPVGTMIKVITDILDTRNGYFEGWVAFDKSIWMAGNTGGAIKIR